MIARLTEDLNTETSRLYELNLSDEAINSIKEIKEIKDALEKAKTKLDKWMSQIGRAAMNEQLMVEIAKLDNFAAQLAGLEATLKKDASIYFYDVIEGYVNAVNEPSLRKKYLGYLEAYEPYIQRRIWGAIYRKRYADKMADKKSRDAMNNTSLASKVNLVSEIDMSDVLVTGKGVIKNTAGSENLIAGGAMVGMDKMYGAKPATPPKLATSPIPPRGPYKGRRN